MAKKKAAKIIAYSAYRLARKHRCNFPRRIGLRTKYLALAEELRFWLKKLENEHEFIVNRSHDQCLEMAYFWWSLYGSLLENAVDDPRSIIDGDGHPPDSIETLRLTNEIETKIFEIHRESVGLLMQEAEKHGIDSTSIELSGRYCREFLSERNRREFYYESDGHIDTSNDDARTNANSWPECLGLALLELPHDVRSAIMAGNAAVLRIEAVLRAKFVAAAESREKWSIPRSPQDWEWIFAFLGDPCSWRTIIRRVERGELRRNPVGTTKSVSFGIEKLPHGYDDTLKPTLERAKQRTKKT